MNPKPLFAPALVTALVVMFASQNAYAAFDGLPPRLPSPPLPERELNSWRFDSTAWQTNARTAPLALIAAEFAPSWSGYALRMEGTNSAIAAFAATNAAGTANLLASGSVRFWFAPDWSSASVAGTGPGSDVVLFETGAWASDSSYVRTSLQVDADGDTIRFVLHGTGGPETILSAALSWNWNEWHQLALVGTTTNTLLYLDGSAAASGSAVAWLPSLVSGRVNGFSVGSDVTGSALAQGNFDELYTYARALSAGEVAFDYNRNSGTAALGPINPELMTSNFSLSFTNIGTNISSIASTSGMVASNFGCKLWLSIERPPIIGTNEPPVTNVFVTLHNTFPGREYRLWSKQQLVATQAWTLETNLFGPTNQSFVSTNVAMKGRSNLFFVATALGGFVTNKSFPGLQHSNALTAPPDTMGAVGPEHFLEILNGTLSVAVFDKCSGARVEAIPSAQFFAVEYQGTNYPKGVLFDPRVLYDHESQRWIACIVDGDPTSKNVILAISKTSSPLNLASNWNTYLLPVGQSDFITDFPTLGVDKSGIYLSVVHATGSVIVSSTVIAIKKPEIFQGSNIMTTTTVPVEDLDGVIQPAVNFDCPPRGGYAWFVSKPARTNSNPYLGGAVSYRRMEWSGTTAGWVDTNWISITNASYRDYFDFRDADIQAPQTNGSPSIRLNAPGIHLSMAVMRDGALWTCHHVGLAGTNGTFSNTLSSTDVDRAAVQWVKISTDTNGNFTSITNGRIFDASVANPRWYYFPSLMVNRIGDIVMGFSGSHSNEFIGAFYAYRPIGGTTSQALLLKSGNDRYNDYRWGDYSYTSLDPTDGLSFWTVQQYADNELINYWGTWISEIIPDVTNP